MSIICNTINSFGNYTYDNFTRHYQINSFLGFFDSLLNSDIWKFNLSNLQTTEDESKTYRLI